MNKDLVCIFASGNKQSDEMLREKKNQQRAGSTKDKQESSSETKQY